MSHVDNKVMKLTITIVVVALDRGQGAGGAVAMRNDPGTSWLAGCDMV